MQTSEGVHDIWEDTLGHYAEAVQEKLLFGYIFDPNSQELVFFERKSNLTEIEQAVLRHWMSNPLNHIRMIANVANGLKFYDGLDKHYLDTNNAVCHYVSSGCPGRLRPLLYNKQWIFRCVGEPNERMHNAHPQFQIDSRPK